MSDFEEFDLPEPPAMAADDIGGSLGQADIDALFGDTSAPPPAKSGLRALVESDVVNQERLPMLEVVCDRVIRSFSTNMRHLTSDAIDVSLDEVSSGRFGELMNRVALPAMFGVFRAEEWDNHGVMIVEPALIYSVVDALLGGRKGSSGTPKVEGRAFTTIETALVGQMMEMVLHDFAAAFEPIADVRMKLERTETSPRFAAIAGPSNVTAVCTFRIEMEGRGGKFAILLPHTTLEPVREKLVQRFMGEKLGRDALWESHMERQLRQTSLRLDAVLAERTLPLSQVQSFDVGQVIPLGTVAGAPVALNHSANPLGVGHLGQHNGHIAVRLLGNLAGKAS